MAVVGIELALKELADEDEAIAILAQTDEVGKQYLAEARGETRREIAHLVGVGEDDVAGVELADELLERGHVTVGGVILEEARARRGSPCRASWRRARCSAIRGRCRRLQPRAAGRIRMRSAGRRRGLPRTCGSRHRLCVPEQPGLRSYDAHLELEFLDQLGGGLVRRAFDELGFFLLLRQVDALERDGCGGGLRQSARRRPSALLWSWPS